MNTNNGKKNTDYLDSLLSVAAKNAGEKDINEYKLQTPVQVSPDTFEKISEKIREGKTKVSVTVAKKKGRLSFRRKLVIAASAALITGALAFGVLANLGKGSAEAIVSSIAGNPVLTYDVSGIKSSTKVTDKVPEILEKQYTKGETKELEDGRSTVYKKDGLDVKYTVRVLDSDYSLKLGNADTDCIGTLICGKHNGYMAITKKDDVIIRSIVAWNDGKYAYELASVCDVDELAEIAQSLY